ncbi:MAG TPA: hypothetical protein VM686_25835 [Polyangiaceae bacterium]|nr:hypothetical protein [Polyangiaceae bacterium]
MAISVMGGIRGRLLVREVFTQARWPAEDGVGRLERESALERLHDLRLILLFSEVRERSLSEEQRSGRRSLDSALPERSGVDGENVGDTVQRGRSDAPQPPLECL